MTFTVITSGESRVCQLAELSISSAEDAKIEAPRGVWSGEGYPHPQPTRGPGGAS